MGSEATRMLDIQGYRTIEMIYTSSTTVVIRAQREGDGQRVIVKTLAQPHPSLADLAQLQRAYQLLRDLACPGAIAVEDLVVYNNRLALVMEDIGGISLDRYAAGQALPLAEFFPIAIGLTHVLSDLHHQRIVHKDIKPSNLILAPQTGQLKAIDFGLATRLSQTVQALESPDRLEGTLAYIAPEQTGRMNRGLDYRSDFYALGVTFYELLTGTLPFVADDPLALIHAHIARQAEPVHERQPGLPPILGAIVAKLMAKDPEDRYQSEAGLRRDLQRVQDVYLADADRLQSLTFPLAERDCNDRFAIPQALYGRDREIGLLNQAFDQAAQGQVAVVFVSGDSGIGKSRLINELHRPVAIARGHFGVGKFELQQRNQPFRAIAIALRAVLGQILSETAADLVQWRDRLQAGLGDEAAVLESLVPELTAILGPLAPVPSLPPVAAQDRFQRALRALVGAIARPDRPLVLFLDDLQWADLSSLAAIEMILAQSLAPSLGQRSDQPTRPNQGLADPTNRAEPQSEEPIDRPPKNQAQNQPENQQHRATDQAANRDINREVNREPVIAGLLLIGAYRHREVSATHPFQLLLNQFQDQFQDHVQKEVQDPISDEEHDRGRDQLSDKQLFDNQANNPTDRQANNPTDHPTDRQSTDQQAKPWIDLRLEPIDRAAIAELVAATLQQDQPDNPETFASFVDYVRQQAGGNPFFTAQFLESLHEWGAVTYDRDLGQWCYDLDLIRDRVHREGGLQLTIERLTQLPPATQEVLESAACLGTWFDLATLAQLCDRDPFATTRALLPALEIGAVVPLGQDYADWTAPCPIDLGGLQGQASAWSQRSSAQVQYVFGHDRLQEAAYGLIDAAQQRLLHGRIAQVLWQRWRSRQGSDPIEPAALAPEDRQALFDLVDRLDLAWPINLSPSQDEVAPETLPIERSGSERSASQRLGIQTLEIQTLAIEPAEIVGLYLAAAEAAKGAIAYATTLNYLQIGRERLQRWAATAGLDPWQVHHELTRQVHLNLAEAAYLAGQPELTEAIAQQYFQHVRDPLARADLQELLIQVDSVHYQLKRAVTTGLQALEDLGFSLPEPTPENLQAAVGASLQLWTPETITDLAQKPDMTHPQAIAALRIVSAMLPVINSKAVDRFPFVVLQMVSLSIRYGITANAAFAFACYGGLLCGFVGDRPAGKAFGELAIALLERPDTAAVASKTLFTVAVTIDHWYHDRPHLLRMFETSHRLGWSHGDLEHAGVAAMFCSFVHYWAGHDLSEIAAIMAKEGATIEELGQRRTLDINAIGQQAVADLQAHQPPDRFLDGWYYSRQDQHARFVAEVDALALIIVGFYSLQLHLIFERPEPALEDIARVRPLLGNFARITQYPLFLQQESLLYLALEDLNDRPDLLALIADNQTLMADWVADAPDNYRYGYELVEAERLRWAGDRLGAIVAYDRALAWARTPGEQAIAYECLARFYDRWPQPLIAKTYRLEAYSAYVRWGARAKVQAMERNYPDLIHRTYHNRPVTSQPLTPWIQTSDQASLAIDLETTLKAASALSSEVQLDRLVETLMRVALENAGATKAALMLPSNEADSPNRPEKTPDRWHVTALAETDRHDLTWYQESLQSFPDLPVRAIEAAGRQQSPIAIDRPASDPDWASEPYFQTHQPQSVLVLPCLRQNQTIALLYLENALAAKAFPAARVRILSILASQMAIALENAYLYEQLENQVADRTRALERANRDLTTTLQNLRRTQSQLIQTEKMSSLGQIVAGIAHEINNPVSFIHGNLKPIKEYLHNLLDLIQCYQKAYPQADPDLQAAIDECDLDFISQDMPRLLNSMTSGTQRIRDIVLSLRRFSHLDRTEQTQVDLHEGLESTLTILQHRLKRSGQDQEIKIIRRYGSLPLVQCYAGQLNQVFMNVISNAIDALEEAGLRRSNADRSPYLEIATAIGPLNSTSPTQAAIITITDNGKGIPPAARDRLFDPFFTTKPIGKGTGLGLAISYQIITEAHGGRLSFTTQDDRQAGETGTEFRIAIPLQPAPKADEPDRQDPKHFGLFL